jgi:hypothetical protein
LSRSSKGSASDLVRSMNAPSTNLARSITAQAKKMEDGSNAEGSAEGASAPQA